MAYSIICCVPNNLLTPRQAAEKFGVTPKTIHRWVTQGILVGVVLPSGRIRVADDVSFTSQVEAAEAVMAIVGDERPISPPNTLYRMWSEQGDLLYIGRTNDPITRFDRHRNDKRWWAEVDSITLEHFETREEMLDAEHRAILTEPTKFHCGTTRDGYVKKAAERKARRSS